MYYRRNPNFSFSFDFVFIPFSLNKFDGRKPLTLYHHIFDLLIKRGCKVKWANMALIPSEIKILLEEFAPNSQLIQNNTGWRLASLKWSVNKSWYFCQQLIFVFAHISKSWLNLCFLALIKFKTASFTLQGFANWVCSQPREIIFVQHILWKKNIYIWIKKRLNLKYFSLWSGCPRWIIWWYRLLWRPGPRGPCRRTCCRSWLSRLPRSWRISGLRWHHLAAECVISWVSNGTSNELTEKDCFQLRGGPAKTRYTY